MLTVFIIDIGLNLRSLNGGDVVTQRSSGWCDCKSSFQYSYKFKLHIFIIFTYYRVNLKSIDKNYLFPNYKGQRNL